MNVPDYGRPLKDDVKDQVIIAPLSNGVFQLAIGILFHMWTHEDEYKEKYPYIEVMKNLSYDQLFVLGTCYTLWEWMLYLAHGEQYMIADHKPDELWKEFVDSHYETYCTIRMQWDLSNLELFTSLGSGLKMLLHRGTVSQLYLYGDLINYDTAIQALIAKYFGEFMEEGKVIVLNNSFEEVYNAVKHKDASFCEEVDDVYDILQKMSEEAIAEQNIAFSDTRFNNFIPESLDTLKQVSVTVSRPLGRTGRESVWRSGWVPRHWEYFSKLESDKSLHIGTYMLSPSGLGGITNL